MPTILFVIVLNSYIFALVIEIIKSQNNNQFYFNFYNKKIKMNFCELLSFRNKLNAIDINTHFYNDGNLFGIEIIALCNLSHVLILETDDVLKLKRITQNIFATQEFELKS